MLGQVFLNGRRHLHILHIGDGRLHLYNERRLGSRLSTLSPIYGTLFGQLDFIPEPSPLRFFARWCFWVIGERDDALVSAGLGACPPLRLPAREVVILLPD